MVTISPSTATVECFCSMMQWSTRKPSRCGVREVAWLPRAAAAKASATRRARVRPRTISTCSPGLPSSTRPPSFGSLSSRSPTPIKTSGVRYGRSKCSVSNERRNGWTPQNARTIASRDARRYPRRGYIRSRRRTNFAYTPTELVLRNNRPFTHATSAGTTRPATATAHASARSVGMP